MCPQGKVENMLLYSPEKPLRNLERVFLMPNSWPFFSLRWNIQFYSKRKKYTFLRKLQDCQSQNCYLHQKITKRQLCQLSSKAASLTQKVANYHTSSLKNTTDLLHIEFLRLIIYGYFVFKQLESKYHPVFLPTISLFKEDIASPD